MPPTQYLTITAIRVPNDQKIEYQVAAAGCTDAYTMEMVSDEIKKQARTHEYLPMEQDIQLLLTCEPLAGWRHVAITERRTRPDFDQPDALAGG